jgi:hypothetical protein
MTIFTKITSKIVIIMHIQILVLLVVVMSRDQKAGQNHNIKIDNKSLERVEQFKYLGTTLTNRKFLSGRN